MWNVLDFLVIFAIGISVHAADLDSMENTFNCYADYLKKHDLLDSKFPSDPFNGEATLCDNLLTTTVSNVYSDLNEEFSKIEELKDASGCIVENLRKAKWSDLEIKEQLFDFSDALSDEKKAEEIMKTKIHQDKISSDAIVLCLAKNEFGGLFEEAFKRDDQEDDVGDYCARSFALENKLVDTEQYEVKLNPKNIITKDVDCAVINKKYFAEAEDVLKQNLIKDSVESIENVDCLIMKYRDHNFFNRILAVAVLGETNITDDQKEFEKNNFIEVMIKITQSLKDC